VPVCDAIIHNIWITHLRCGCKCGY
jgi:hypothetical protein